VAVLLANDWVPRGPIRLPRGTPVFVYLVVNQNLVGVHRIRTMDLSTVQRFKKVCITTMPAFGACLTFGKQYYLSLSYNVYVGGSGRGLAPTHGYVFLAYDLFNRTWSTGNYHMDAWL
jgi:hypothetical protein